MTNAEKYKDVIIAQECKTGDWAVNRRTGNIVACDRRVWCQDCALYNHDDGCEQDKVDWLNAEYREPKEFTDDERKVIELLDKVEWVARDDNGEVYGFVSMPHKKHGIWYNNNPYCLKLALYTSLPFVAIKSTDTEPTSRAEILVGKHIRRHPEENN